jgi:hypothetical protein
MARGIRAVRGRAPAGAAAGEAVDGARTTCVRWRAPSARRARDPFARRARLRLPRARRARRGVPPPAARPRELRRHEREDRLLERRLALHGRLRLHRSHAERLRFEPELLTARASGRLRSSRTTRAKHLDRSGRRIGHPAPDAFPQHRDTDPTWAPDAAEVAWARLRDGNWELHVANVDGTGDQRLTRGSAPARSATDRIALVRSDGAYRTSIRRGPTGRSCGASPAAASRTPRRHGLPTRAGSPSRAAVGSTSSTSRPARVGA